MKKTIYTYKWRDTGRAYTGQTNSFDNRNRQHTQSGKIAEVMWEKPQKPIWLLQRTGKLIIEMFLSDNPDIDEHNTINKNGKDGWHMINKVRK